MGVRDEPLPLLGEKGGFGQGGAAVDVALVDFEKTVRLPTCRQGSCVTGLGKIYEVGVLITHLLMEHL
jgi:hypothetical protein